MSKRRRGGRGREGSKGREGGKGRGGSKGMSNSNGNNWYTPNNNNNNTPNKYNNRAFDNSLLNPSSGMVIQGAPRVGKTHSMKYLAKQLLKTERNSDKLIIHSDKNDDSVKQLYRSDIEYRKLEENVKKYSNNIMFVVMRAVHHWIKYYFTENDGTNMMYSDRQSELNILIDTEDNIEDLKQRVLLLGLTEIGLLPDEFNVRTNFDITTLDNCRYVLIDTCKDSISDEEIEDMSNDVLSSILKTDGNDYITLAKNIENELKDVTAYYDNAGTIRIVSKNIWEIPDELKIICGYGMDFNDYDIIKHIGINGCKISNSIEVKDAFSEYSELEDIYITDMNGLTEEKIAKWAEIAKYRGLNLHIDE